MNTAHPIRWRPGTKASVIALHCSGGSPRQWKPLAERLSATHEVIAPLHPATATIGTSDNELSRTLGDAAQAIVPLIMAADRPVHLVGHSSGGALALHLAKTWPDRVASLSLFEPCTFHILPQLGCIAADEYKSIREFAASIVSMILNGQQADAMRTFVDYWGGTGTWDILKSSDQAQLINWSPNVVQEFEALFLDATALEAYAQLGVPTLLLQGEHSPNVVKTVANALWGLLPQASITRLSNVGHMGPITHAAVVANMIQAHISQCDIHHSRSSVQLTAAGDIRPTEGSVESTVSAA